MLMYNLYSINSLRTRNPLTATLAISEDPDEMPNRPWAGYRPPSPPGGILYTMIFWNNII